MYAAMNFAHNSNRFTPGNVYVMQMTISAVKHKLMSHTGSSPGSMQLQLKDESGNLLDHLSDDNRLLGYYSPYNG